MCGNQNRSYKQLVTSSVKNKRVNAFMLTAQLTFSTLTQFRISCQGNDAIHKWLILPVLIKVIKIILQRHTHIGQPDVDNPSLNVFSQVILDRVKLTI